MTVCRRLVTLLLVFAPTLVFNACGGGGSSAAPTPSGPVAISVSPVSQTMNISATQQFTATVTNTTNTAVNWTLQESGAGTISTSGNYTAPTTPGTYHVIATSQADATKTANAAVTVQATTPTISSTPPATAAEGVAYVYDVASTDPGGTAVTLTMTASPTGATFASNRVTWSPTNVQSRNANNFTITATTAAGGTKTQSWTVTPTGSVILKSVNNYRLEDGTYQTVTQTVDGTTIESPNGTGGFTTIAPVLQGDGSYKFANVPAGGYFVNQYNNQYQWQTGNSLDWSFNSWGRSDATFGSVRATYQLSGLQSTVGGDELRLMSLNSGLIYQIVLGLPLGSTSGTFSKTSSTGGLPDASKGDKTVVCQVTGALLGARLFQNITGCSAPLDLTIPTGVQTTISATLGTIPTGTYRMHIAGDTYHAETAHVSPSATELYDYFSVNLYPTAQDIMFNGYRPIYAARMPSSQSFTTDEDLGVMTYGNPFPSLVPGFTYLHYVKRSYTAPGASTGTDFSTSFAEYTSTAPTATAPLALTISPVRSPMINSKDLFVDQTGVGTTPTLSWTAPSTGTATSYLVIFGRVELSGTTTTISGGNAIVVTPNTSVTIPAGILVAGKTYLIEIDANIEAGTGSHYASAPVMSGLITP